MTQAPPEVDATELDDDIEPVEDVFAGAGEPEAAADPDSPFQFQDTDWPEAEKPAPKPKPVNPFQAKIDAMLEPGVLPTRGVVFEVAGDDDDTKKRIRRQIQNAAGERATSQVVFTPADEGKLTVRFRLMPKRKITRTAPAAAVDSDAAAGDQAD